jgi:hypothetical protein
MTIFVLAMAGPSLVMAGGNKKAPAIHPVGTGDRGFAALAFLQ